MGLGEKTVSGIIWTSAGEILVKFISPVSFLVLANILSPSDFGIVAIATTVLSFVNIISDLGTGKVLVQLKSKPLEFDNYCTSAFWFNIVIGLTLWVIIFGFSNLIAQYNGQPQAATVIRVMSFQVIFSSLSTVQVSIMNREMNFKSLFFIRLVTVAVPAIVSIPIAFLGGGLWAIVFGNLSGSFFHMLVLWIYSPWKPSLSFYKESLIKILSKSLWSSLQQIVVWIPVAFDTYLLSNYLSSSSLGLYTTGRSLFQSVSMLTMGPMLTVIFSSLSKINDNGKLREHTLFAQKTLFSISSFMAIFVFIYSELIAKILFTEKWDGIADIMSIIFVLMGFEAFYSVIIESLRARGYFKELALNNLISVIISIPFVFYSAKIGLIAYTITRCMSLYLCYFGAFYYSKKYISISLLDCVVNCKHTLISALVIFITIFFINRFMPEHYYILATMTFVIVGTFFTFEEKEGMTYLIGLFMHKKK